MIIDVSGVELTPGKRGKDCFGNGQHFDKNGGRIEFCCEECDYFLCCTRDHTMRECVEFCNHQECPRWHFVKPNRFSFSFGCNGIEWHNGLTVERKNAMDYVDIYKYILKGSF